MKASDIVLTILPQDDKKKRRPVLILSQMLGFGDFLVCAISTQLLQFTNGFDLILEKNDASFKETGLLENSLIRLSNLAVIPRQDIVGVIGRLEMVKFNLLIINLTKHLLKTE
jgi:mRNA interferase MazF